MQFCILAAGEGSRLVQEGVATPKPLVKIDGQPMIGRLISQMIACDAESVSIIVNSEMKEVREYLEVLRKDAPVPVNVLVKSTPSSMHSFYELSSMIRPDKFVMTTVDTIFRTSDMRRYVRAFAESDAQAFMAVTRYIDDEKPLYVEVDGSMRVTAFSDARPADAAFVSGGIYGLDGSSFPIVRECVESGNSRMRNFQRELIKKGLNVMAWDFGKILDVDHAGDIVKANEFISSESAEMPEVAFVTRSKMYSPNNINSDTKIITLVAENLERKGVKVAFFDEDAADLEAIASPVIVNMCRKPESIEILQRLEREGRLVVNSGYGIDNCTREKMTRILEECGVPVPESLIVDTVCDSTESLLAEAGFGRCWIKRGDGHSIHKEDVSYVRHGEEAKEVLEEYRLRGISRAVINRHLEGDLVKFYGVAGSDFFFMFYPLEEGHSKFGQEEVNGAAHHYKYDAKALYDCCQRAADAMHVDVFGGDCIVDAEGRFSIIDFNDWPSFSPCREAASQAIAEAIVDRIKNHMKTSGK